MGLAPLHVQKAIAALQDEMKGMDVKLGVSRQQLLHLHLKNHQREA